jgi:hypothetical protein
MLVLVVSISEIKTYKKANWRKKKEMGLPRLNEELHLKNVGNPKTVILDPAARAAIAKRFEPKVLPITTKQVSRIIKKCLGRHVSGGVAPFLPRILYEMCLASGVKPTKALQRTVGNEPSVNDGVIVSLSGWEGEGVVVTIENTVYNVRMTSGPKIDHTGGFYRHQLKKLKTKKPVQR